MSGLRLPSFLIIGAMKAGTTTLYRDLLDSGGIYFAPDKETDQLSTDAVLTQSGLAHYSALYESASATDICGDASTSYSKLPVVMGVPERAERVLGQSLKIIYVVRHPVDRIKSHHHFLRIRDPSIGTLDVAVRSNPDYLNFSKYWMQLSPWRELFDETQILVVELERYARDRERALRTVRSFLNLDQVPLKPISETIYNQTYGQPIVTGIWRRVSDHPLYRRVIRPHLGTEFRRRAQLRLLPKSYSEAEHVGNDTLAYLQEALQEDVSLFQNHVGIGWEWNGFAREPL